YASDSEPASAPPTSAKRTWSARPFRERTRVVRSTNAAATITAPAAAADVGPRTPAPKAPSAPAPIARGKPWLADAPLAKIGRRTPSHTRAMDDGTGPKRPAIGAKANRNAAATTKAILFMSESRRARKVVVVRRCLSFSGFVALDAGGSDGGEVLALYG